MGTAQCVYESVSRIYGAYQFVFALLLTDAAINLMTANNAVHRPYHRGSSPPGAQSLPLLYLEAVHLSPLLEHSGMKYGGKVLTIEELFMLPL